MCSAGPPRAAAGVLSIAATGRRAISHLAPPAALMVAAPADKRHQTGSGPAPKRNAPSGTDQSGDAIGRDRVRV